MTTKEDWVTAAIQQTCQALGNLTPPIVDYISYGAIDLDPRHLAVWFAFADNAALAEAQACGHPAHIRSTLLRMLRKQGYPAEALSEIHVGFVGKQEVDEAGGPWIYFR